jgi:hypothetical protein
MNKDERVRCVIEGGTPDRPPVYDALRNDAAIEYYSGQPLALENGPQAVYQAIGAALDATKQFIRFPEDPREIIDARGRRVTYQRWTYWEEPLHFSHVDQAAAYLQNTLDDPADFWGDPAAYVRQAEEDYRNKKKMIGEAAIFLDIDTTEDFHNFYSLMGLEMFSYLAIDYPDLLGEYLDLAVQRALQRIDAITIHRDLPGVFDGIDLAYKTSTLFSPKLLRRVLFPRVEVLMDAYHSKGIHIMFHSDGNLWGILDDLVALGIDALHPIEVLAGMDLGLLRKKYPELILIGGIDCSQLLPFATPGEVAREVRSAIETAGPGYMVGSSTELHNSIPLDNVRAMIDTAREYSY